MNRFILTIKDIYNSYNFSKFVVISLQYVRFVIQSRINKKIEIQKFLNYNIHFSNRSVLFGLLVEIFFKRTYKPILDINRKNIIDCGSNIGISMLYFNWENPQSRIICFEPNPDAITLLRKNILVNNLKNIDVIEAALGDSIKTVNFFVENAVKASTGGSISNSDNKSNTFKVNVVPLSNYIFDKVDYLKLDIEGAEAEVVEDLINTNKISYIQEMSIEYHKAYLRDTYPLERLVERIKDQGFTCKYEYSSMHQADSSSATVMIRAWREIIV